MAVDPMDAFETAREEAEAAAEKAERAKRDLNNYVAVTIALLATFLGLCSVKADNVAQAMQKAESERVNSYAWYQARNIREEVMRATSVQLQAQSETAAPAARAIFAREAARYAELAKEQETKKAKQQKDGEEAAKTYERLNVMDDQFDISDAMLAIAISLLALTSLTQKRWLFALAMLPTGFGLIMGCAGLFNANLHFDSVSKLLAP